VEPVLPAFKYPCIEKLVHSFGPMTLGNYSRQSNRSYTVIKRQVSPVNSSLDRDCDSHHRTVTTRASEQQHAPVQGKINHIECPHARWSNKWVCHEFVRNFEVQED
jgi:hypothetical protein